MIMSCGDKKANVPGDETTTASSGAKTGSSEGIPLVIGTYTRKEGHVNGRAEGIHLAFLEDGKIRYEKSIPAGINPSYLAIHPNKPYVYAANEIGSPDKGETTGGLTALSYDDDYKFQTINTRATSGAHSCHVSVTKYGSHVLTASYGGGDIAMYPLTLEGKTGNPGYNEISFEGSGPHSRQQSPHLHFISEGPGGLIYTADLGTDSVRVFTMTSGVLTPHKHQIVVAAGAGPRHIAFHPEQSLLFIVNELNATIETWRFDRVDAPFKRLQTISTLELGQKGFGHCGAIKITPDGKHLYATNRGDYNNIVHYTVQSDGQLVMVGHESTQGKTPRDMEISPDGKYLIVANQDTDNIVAFEIDPNTGALKNGQETKGILSPVCIKFLN